MSNWWRDVLDRRPWWMNGLMLFSMYMAIIYCPYDWLLRPVHGAEDVWFGIVFRGVAAKLTEPLHWAVYAAGAYGFWRMRTWMWPWAALYTAQVAFAMFVWHIAYRGGLGGWFMGLVTAAVFALVARALWNSQELFGRRRPSLAERYGQWALITGASSGIGAEFARALARDGVNCVLSARRKDRLEELAAELETSFNVSTKVMSADLAKSNGADKLADALKELEIGILINNAGFGYAGRFDKLDTKRLEALVQVNCAAPMVLASRLLGGMRERGRGAIIFTSSVAGRQPLPLHGAYAASKAFDSFLAEALWLELRENGIDVLALEPGATATEFQEVAGEDREPGEPAANVVEVALDALGLQPSVVSGWANWLRANGTRLLPRSITLFLAHHVIERQTPAEMR